MKDLIDQMGLGQFCAMILVISTLIFFVADCAGGKSLLESAIVYNKEYRESWVEYYIDNEIYTDANGNVQVRLVPKVRFHPEEHNLFVSIGNRHRQISTTAAVFHAFQPPQPVHIKTRYGRYTKWRYYDAIVHF